MLGLSEYLIADNLSTFAFKTLEKVSDHGSLRYMQCIA
jgi:hypothetical protein